MHIRKAGRSDLRLVLMSSLSVVALLAHHASAQTTAAAPAPSESAVQEVVVTAQRRQESIQSVPISVTAVSAAKITTENLSTSQDLAKVTPSLVFNSGGNFGEPHIRGIGTGADSPTLENPVALYVDGVYYASQAAFLFSLDNIAQIEVDKGPQGTLFGRNATGGLIQVKTLEPADQFGGFASASVENYSTVMGSVYLTGPVAKNLNADLSVSYRDQGQGYGRDIITGQQVNKTDNVVARSKWVYNLDATKITLIADYSRTVGNIVNPTGPGAIQPPGGQPLFSNWDIAVPSSYNNSNQQGGISLQVTHDFGYITLVSTSAYRQLSAVDLYPNNTTNLLDLTTVNLKEDQDQATQEFQLQSKRGTIFDWTAGIFLFYAKGQYDPAVIGGEALAPLESIVYNSSQTTYSFAGYGQGTFHLPESTDLTVGARYTSDWRDLNLNQALNAPFQIPTTIESASKSFSDVTWRVALDHKLDKNILVYVSANTGFKGGGFNDFNAPATTYAPETLTAFEGGFKSDLFDRRLRLNADAFYYDYSNIQEQRYEDGIQVIYNGAAAAIYGLEIEGTARPTSHLSIDFGLSYLHSEFTSFPDADITSPAVGGGDNIVSGSAKGNTLPYTPIFSGNVAATYTITTQYGDIAASVDYYHSTGYYGSPDNRLRQPAYDLVGAHLSLESTDHLWCWTLYGRNLSDTRYAETIIEQANGDGFQWAPPRTVGVKLDRKF